MSNKIKFEDNQITLIYEDGKIEKFKPESNNQLSVGTHYFDYLDSRYFLVTVDEKKKKK